MQQTLYPTLGTKVSYVCQDSNGNAAQGYGIVLGIGLDKNKRPTAHLGLENDEKLNVPVSCLNPTGEFLENFALAIKTVKNLSDEGNEKVKTTLAEYNSKMEQAFGSLLGEVVNLEKTDATENTQAV